MPMNTPNWQAKPMEWGCKLDDLSDPPRKVGRTYSVPVFDLNQPENDPARVIADVFATTQAEAEARARLVAAVPAMRAALAEFGRLPITRRRVLELGVIFADAIAASEGR